MSNMREMQFEHAKRIRVRAEEAERIVRDLAAAQADGYRLVKFVDGPTIPPLIIEAETDPGAREWVKENPA